MEWQGELPQFGQKRLAALIWVLALAPVCAWEATTTPGFFRRLGVAAPSVLLVGIGLAPFVCVTVEVSDLLGFPPVVTVFLAIGVPVVLPVILLVGVIGWFYRAINGWDEMTDSDSP